MGITCKPKYKINMKLLVLVLLGLFALSAARPSDIINFSVEEDNVEQEDEQEGTAGSAVEGEYSWTAPNGEEFVVKYIADHMGYRIVESNALPEAPEVEDVAEFRAAEEDEGDEDEEEEDDE